MKRIVGSFFCVCLLVKGFEQSVLRGRASFEFYSRLYIIIATSFRQSYNPIL